MGVMDNTVGVAAAIAAVSTLYATAGQAGGTAFLAILAIATFPPGELRPTSLLLNVVAASYATWRLHAGRAINWNAVGRLATASLPAAFLGGLIVLDARIYMILTGLILILAGGLMVTRRKADTVGDRPMQSTPILMTGAGVGLLSGLTGVGGGVFLAPVLIFLGWASPRRAAGLSAPFILANSTIGLAGALLAGQRIADGVEIYALASLVGAVIGTAIGLRWMSQAATRCILASILVFAGLRMLL